MEKYLTELAILSDLSLSILGAGIIGCVAFVFNIPLILAFIGAGALLGPNLGLGLIKNTESIAFISHIGLVFLMFILGMEIDIKKLHQAGRAVMVNGVTQFLGCALLALAVFYPLGYSMGGGNFNLLYLAFAVSISSTLLVVKILSERAELSTLTSRITIGILVVQDIWAISFMAMQSSLSHLQPLIVVTSLLKAISLIMLAWLIAKFTLPRVFLLMGRQAELMLLAALGWCFGISELAHWLGLSREMGALVAGIVTASFPYHLDVSTKVTILRDFFITIYFIVIGMMIPVPTEKVLILAGAIVALVLVSRLFTIYPVMYMMGYGNRVSLIPSLNLAQVSEFSIVLLTLGVSYGQVDADILSAFILAFVALALVSSFLIPRTHEVFRILDPWFVRIGLKDRIEFSPPNESKKVTNMASRIFILGFQRDASSFLFELLKRHTPESMKDLLVVDYNPETLRQLKTEQIDFRYGHLDSFDTLKKMGINEAACVICLVPDRELKNTTNLKILRFLKKLNPTLKVIVNAETMSSAREMYHEGADYVFIPRIISSTYLIDVFERLQTGNAEKIREHAIDFLSKRNEIIP